MVDLAAGEEERGVDGGSAGVAFCFCCVEVEGACGGEGVGVDLEAEFGGEEEEG